MDLGVTLKLIYVECEYSQLDGNGYDLTSYQVGSRLASLLQLRDKKRVSLR